MVPFLVKYGVHLHGVVFSYTGGHLFLYLIHEITTLNVRAEQTVLSVVTNTVLIEREGSTPIVPESVIGHDCEPAPSIPDCHSFSP
jgi:hypothetical protein